MRLKIGVTIVFLTALLGDARASDISIQLDTGNGFVVKDSSGAVERLRVHEASGNISRNGSLFLHTSGTNSTFAGANAGNLATTGSFNSALGDSALAAITSGSANAAFGYQALGANFLGSQNSAFGALALDSATTASNNSAFGYNALTANGSGTRNAAFGALALDSSTTGSDNAAFGYSALQTNASGQRNSAFGAFALDSNAIGFENAAFGYQALQTNTANENTAFGTFSSQLNTSGAANTAIGYLALHGNTTSGANTAVGRSALQNSTGSGNVALGYFAGSLLTSGGNNIYIGNAGVASESNAIRIGGGHVSTFIDGIFGSTSSAGIAVFVNANDQLGTATSSARFKEQVHDMGETSSVLPKLRPVTFRYRKEVSGGDDLLQYGLIAEEVAQVAPGLVQVDETGKPYAVRYHFLTPMLLNEMQKQQRTIERQQQVIAELASRLTLLEGRVGSAAASKAVVQ